MGFGSILFDRAEDGAVTEETQPSFFTDLNLDQVLTSLLVGRAEYDLAPFFYTPVHSTEAVRYRQEVLQDLERDDVRGLIAAFAGRMRTMREQLAQAAKLRYRYQKQRWFLDAVNEYCQAVGSLTEDFRAATVDSAGLRGFRDYLVSYTESGTFTKLVSVTDNLYRDLAVITYSIHIKGNRVQVGKHEGEPDYSLEVEKSFAKFQQGAVRDYRCSFRSRADMDHVEAQILELVAQLFPEVFQRLTDYCAGNQNYADQMITGFDREVQFYLAYLEFTARLRNAGMDFCYPQISSQSKQVSADGAFDIALASKLVQSRASTVCNDFSLAGAERILVVTGPNQGGKTTFARMFGQLHYLASLGLPVPARQAHLFLPDQIFTHFEREEDITTLRGKLKDELVRVHDILERATGDSIVIMNESFTSTTLEDALFLGGEVMRRLMRLGLLGVYVTFADELASLTEATVSMVAAIAPDNPAARTFKIERKPADGLAYAAAIAGKYGLTFARVTERIAL
ncbi:MAG: MutS-related protein [Streptosporangiaceae bacterium]